MTVERSEGSRAEDAPAPARDEEQPAPRHVLDDPDVKRKVEVALDRVEQGKSRRGKTADELLGLAGEHGRVDA